MKNKRGISPLVATVLLVGFVVFIVLVIILWGRGVYTEQAQKSEALQESERKCLETSIDVNVIANGVRVINTGSNSIRGLLTREEITPDTGEETVRLNTIYVEIQPGDFFDLVYGSSGTCPEVGLCGNTVSFRVWAGQQQGFYRDEPLITCPDEKKITR